ncbi:MAG: ABC transporter ATP-binding protein [bacterium]|nr:ABC transporter ATP-binding protein [bacterium]
MTHPKDELVIALDKLCFSFGSNLFAVANADLKVERGEVVGFLGRNGAGKTTLLRCIGGILSPTSGQVRVFGQDPLAEGFEVKQRLGYVDDERSDIKDLNIQTWMELHEQLFPTWDPDYASGLLERFELVPKRKFKHLSKGQARLAALIVALAHRPELLILDEPSGGLDPVARRVFLELLLPAIDEDQTTVLFSSHQLQDVERIASRIVLMNYGQIVIDEPIDRVTEQLTLVALASATAEERRQLQGYSGTLSERRLDNGTSRFLIHGSEGELKIKLDLPFVRTSYLPVNLEDLFLETMGSDQ